MHSGPSPIEARKIRVQGIVQGVGFRPFVYQLATTLDLAGRVSNTSSGVSIELEGRSDRLLTFVERLSTHSPPLSQITRVDIASIQPAGYQEFTIVHSQKGSQRATLISPDVSICEDCRAELFDPQDRRFRYPFINCTNCGPRYTIINDIPYDRPKTSMRHFKMCPECQSEYDDPGNRRFHAQPNACPVCGPQASLFDRARNKLKTTDPIETAIKHLHSGRVLAVKGLGGFHLVVDAHNQDAVTRLRHRKRREEKPLAVMSANLRIIRQYAEIRPEEATLLQSHQRPIVLLEKSRHYTLAGGVSPNNRTIGVMLPYTPLHYLLVNEAFTALVMTSANLSEEPIAIDNQDAFKRLADIADFFLIHDRDIYLRSDDSVVRFVNQCPRFLRRSRGYVPVPVFLKHPIKPILACGAELKNTIGLSRGSEVFLSQHIGDLENLATYDFFELTIAHLRRILSIEPEIIACDMHPDYLSTRYADKQEHLEKITVQHHHAHIVSCMAENQVIEPVIGLSFDGTGYGTDGSIWGGEVLLARYDGFERVAHLAPTPMPGGAAAIKEPWRMAISYLHQTYGEGFRNRKLAFLESLTTNQISITTQMIEKGVNVPQTSSLGRFFDGISALMGLRTKVAFEGQAAMELEMLASGSITDVYDYAWSSQDGYQIDPRAIIQGIVTDVENDILPAVISDKFHTTLIKLFSDLCRVLKKETGISQVALSGGCFQNAILLGGLARELQTNGFQVLTHKKVPANDGGICLGQALIADAQT
jgi:hydrogenase maturation protein HypF